MKHIVISLLTWLSVALSASAQDFSSLERDFDSRNLSHDDRRFLQAALAFEGDYIGLLDGQWGRLSQGAFARFAQREFGTSAQDWQLAVLAFNLVDRYDEGGWSIQYFSNLDISLLFPTKFAISEPSSDEFANWSVRGSSLGYSFAIAPQIATERYHNYVLSKHGAQGEPYTVRRDNFAVSSSTSWDGATLYAWSVYRNGSWTTALLSASHANKNELNAVAASLQAGRGRPLVFTEGGYLQTAVERTVALLESADTAPAPSAENEVQEGSGSGLFVSYEGHVLTNAHVVEGCSEIRVNGNMATVRATSQMFDLAILQTTMDSTGEVARFSPTSARLNSDVTVAGYPYAGLLGGLNITRGSISSVIGAGGDETRMQLTAPVQSGNSGGPVIANDGEVVGVIVSKLDALRLADATGDVPQNVNFAIRGEIAKLFLSQNGVEPLLGLNDKELSPEDLGELSSQFTAFVECR